MAISTPRFGPGMLVAAAFIGPGTVTTASIAGAEYGFALLWAILFSLLATFILQEMSARLGLVTRLGLAESIRDSVTGHWSAALVIALIVGAVGIGNAAYQAGNIIGGAIALESLTGTSASLWSAVIALVAALLLWSGRYAVLEAGLGLSVIIMSAVFLLTLYMIKPPLGEMLHGLLVPRLPPGSILTVMALIGTTVVPYNLFLHASAATQRWSPEIPLRTGLHQSRMDAGLSIGLGGLITLAVLSTSATAYFGTDTTLSPATMAVQLEPLLGSHASWLFGLGLFAAGLSSAITAPLAAAYAVCGAMAWDTSLRSARFRMVWLAVLLFGASFAVLGTKPLVAILFAQATNGFLLPVCAVFLLMVMNRKRLLGEYRNRALANVAGAVVVIITGGLGALKISQSLF